MANRIRYAHALALAARFVLARSLLFGVILHATGCRTPWRELSAPPVENGIRVKELLSQSSESADETLEDTKGRARELAKNSRFDQAKDYEPDRNSKAKKIDAESDSEPAWITEGLQAAPPQQRDLLHQQVRASLQTRESRNRPAQPAASQRVSDHDATASRESEQFESGSSFKLSDNAESTPRTREVVEKHDTSATISKPPVEQDSKKISESTPLKAKSSSRKSGATTAVKRSAAKESSDLPQSLDDIPGGGVRTASAESTDIEPGATHIPSASEVENSTAIAATSIGTGPQTELDWRGHLREALKGLERENESATLSPEQKLHHETVKRMLGLSLGDIESAMEPIDCVQPNMQDFFRYQFQALHDAIDSSGNPVLSRRWTLALQNARKALVHLSAASNLEVQNTAFCSEVESFGVTTKFPQYQFRPEQELLLYCELDNFVAAPVKDGYETQLQGSYEIVDSTGRRVADKLLQLDEHVCRNPRRDYFIAYRIFMPREIAPGRFQLKLTIEDMKGKKFGQSTIDFQISQ